MAVTNYNELIEEVKRYAKRSTLTGVGNFISLAEERIKYGYGEERDPYFTEAVRIGDMVKTGTLNVAAGAVSVTLPADFIEFADTPYLDASNKRPMAVVSKSNRVMRASFAASAAPVEYAIVGKNMLFTAPSDGSYTIPIAYYSLAGLSSSNTTNNLLTARPSIYLWATLLEWAIYAKSKGAIEQNLMLYKGAVSGAARYEDERSFAGSLVIRSDVGVY